MIKVEYKRDMQHNYFILHDELRTEVGYQEKMLYYNKLKGFVPFHVQSMNGERLISYNVHGYQPLIEVCNKFPLKVFQLQHMVENLFEILYQASEYLLKEDDLLLSIDYMFVQLPSYQLSLCYYTGYQIPIKTQLAEFFERLMTCVDYEDKEAVYLIYTLYMKSKEQNATMTDMIELLNSNVEENEGRNINSLENIKLVSKQQEAITWRSNENQDRSGPKLEGRNNYNNQLRRQEKDSIRWMQESMKTRDESIKEGNTTKQRNTIQEHNAIQERNTIQECNIKEPDKRKVGSKVSEEGLSSMYDCNSRDRDLYKRMDEMKMRESEVKNREDSLAMISPAMKATYEPPNTEVKNSKKPLVERKSSNISRPLTNHIRQEEQEVLSYPIKYYIFAGILLVAVMIVCGLIASTGILKDSVTKQVEPIKIIGMILVICIPAGYGLYYLFQPQNRVVKEVTIGLYEPMAHQEIAASVDIPVYKGDSYQNKSSLVEPYRKIPNENTTLLKNSLLQSLEKSDIEKSDNSYIEKMEKNRGERCTVLLHKGTQGAFPQLISEAPELVESIPIQECPFFIGTAKNRLNYSLTSPVISRYHAKIEEMEGTYFLSDLSSSNGTFLNGKRLHPEEANILIPGDKISFANISFIFTCPNG